MDCICCTQVRIEIFGRFLIYRAEGMGNSEWGMRNEEETTRDSAAKSDVEHRNPNCPLLPAPCPLNPPRAEEMGNSEWGMGNEEETTKLAAVKSEIGNGNSEKGQENFAQENKKECRSAWFSIFLSSIFLSSRPRNSFAAAYCPLSPAIRCFLLLGVCLSPGGPIRVC